MKYKAFSNGVDCGEFEALDLQTAQEKVLAWNNISVEEVEE